MNSACSLFDLNPSEICRLTLQMQQIHALSPLAYWMIVIGGVLTVLTVLKAMLIRPVDRKDK